MLLITKVQVQLNQNSKYRRGRGGRRGEERRDGRGMGEGVGEGTGEGTGEGRGEGRGKKGEERFNTLAGGNSPTSLVTTIHRRSTL